jgi:hypothetical protein
MIRMIFLVAGLYDLLLGLGFVFFGPEIFEKTGVPPPNHWGYIQFGALLPYGMLLKLSYFGLVTYYWATTDCPLIFKVFALIDAVMLVLFLLAYNQRSLLAPATLTTVSR